MSDSQGLYVPIDLAAYCVGAIDATFTPDFSGATTSYVSQMGTNHATLSSNVLRGFDQSPLWPLEEGVHLHWAMPDGLTHTVADSSSSDLDYSALPNRWLLTRLIINGTTIQKKSWIITSDILAENKPNGKNVPTLPVSDPSVNFRYVGAWEVYTQDWKEPVLPPDQSIEALFGSPLHAVASGDVAFAAFYPNNRNIYGFFDDMSDIPSGTTAKVSYSIVGWFADPTHDPMSKKLSLATLQSTYKWTCLNYDDASPASYSLYHGLIQDITWNSDTRYIIPNSTPINVDVAVGQTPSEALAAYFDGVNQEPPLFEELFTAFEIGALADFQQPKPGQLASLNETLHEKQFSRFDGGSLYSIEQKDFTASLTPITLPLNLADALNLLNKYQQELDMATYEISQYQWQLFASWYRIIEVVPANATAAYNSLSSLINNWKSVQDAYAKAEKNKSDQYNLVQGMLGNDLVLKKIPAPPFYQPNEPVMLLASNSFKAARRYGGDGDHHLQGYLMCRLSTQCLTSITVKTSSERTFQASQFSSLLLPTPNFLNYCDDIDRLTQETALLNTLLIATYMSGDPAIFKHNLEEWLAGNPKEPDIYTAFTGNLPSPVASHWMSDGNPWFPMFLLWDIYYYPLSATVSPTGVLGTYSPKLFTANYSVDPNQVGFIAYTPGNGEGAINIDPKTINFNPIQNSAIQVMSGSSILSSAASDSLKNLLTTYLATHTDSTLQTILDQLNSTNMLMQSLSGFNARLLMQHQNLQMGMNVASNAPLPIRNLTKQVQSIITDITAIAPEVPDFNGYFNPFRAGYAQFGLQMIDAFGQRRPLNVSNFYSSDTAKTYYNDTFEPGIMYLQPRLTQPSRLLFRWLAADTTEYDETNSLPATSPVCGWLLTNHLSNGIFIYDKKGVPLGSLTPSLSESRIIWQTAPGDNSLINQTIEQVFEHKNTYLANLVFTLSKTSVANFKAFWTSIDTAAGLTTPSMPNSSVGLSVLMGRPLALIQASMLLEMQGFAENNLSWSTLQNGQYARTDNGLTAIQFPVVIGDLNQIDDGLIGYFKQADDKSFDLSTFYSEVSPDNRSWVQKPLPTNILLTPKANTMSQSPSDNAGETKFLILMDPRCGLHVTTGILPTQYNEIPSYQYTDILSNLEMTFLTTPLLKPAAGMTIPLSKEDSYTWSWIEEDVINTQSKWVVQPNIASPSANAVWAYSPQGLTEGWLRLNPDVLTFTLANNAGKPVVNPGQSNTLTLTITNKLQGNVEFEASSIVHEGDTPSGSLIYVHFGSFIQPSDVANVTLTATGWTSQVLVDPVYGTYLAFTPNPGTSVPLQSNQSLTFTMANVKVDADASGLGTLFFDYNRITGIPGDGTEDVSLTIASTTALIN